MKSLLLLATATLLSVLPVEAEVAPASAKPFEAESTAGTKVRFPQDYKGKLVMLDFWATWCGPCVAELPNLTKVYADLHPKRVEVLGISLDNERTVSKLPEFTKAKGMTWTQISDGKGWEAELAKLYDIHSIPSCFLVDGTTGKILASGPQLRGASLRVTLEKHLGLPVSNTPAVTAERNAPPDPLLAKADAAVKAGHFLTHAEVRAQMKQPKPGAIDPRPVASVPLSSREIAKVAREAHLRAGWFYSCSKCGQMHLNMAGAYAITPDVVVTVNHLLEPPATLKEGWLIVVDQAGQFHPTTAVIAANASLDAALVRVSGRANLKPLAMRADVEQGERAFCYSDPLKRQGYFSDGIVNRFFSADGSNDPMQQRINVSTDWAQGSSGSAVLDECGNVIGHVARIQTFNSNPPDKNTHSPSNGTTLVLHEAIPASAILKLVKEAAKAD